MLVKQIDDAPHHFPASIIASRLSDGNDLDLVLGEFAFIDAELDAITEKARQAVNDDGLECRRFEHGICKHLLKNWPLVIGGRCTWLDIFLNHQMAVSLCPFIQLAQLVRDRQIIFRLARCRYSRI